MLMSEQIAELAAAMASVQGKMHAATKSSVNPHIGNKYADLGAVFEACRDLLAENQLAVMQWPGPYDAEAQTLSLTTVLTHASGQWLSQELTIPVAKMRVRGGGEAPMSAQAYGSAITYARRYALAAVVGITQEDDDGNAASHAPAQPQAAAPQSAAPQGERRKVAGKTITEKQQKRMFAILKKAGHDPDDVKAWVVTKYGVASRTEILMDDYEEICARLEDPTPIYVAVPGGEAPADDDGWMPE